MLKDEIVEVKREVEELKKMKKEISSAKKIKEELTYMNLISLIKLIIVMWTVSIVLVVGAFLIYMNQYDFESEETTTTYEGEQDADTGDIEGDKSGNINFNLGGTING